MIGANRLPRPQLDEPWRRLVWLTPSALTLWAALLAGFALVLGGGGSHQTIERLDARLIDLPPVAPAGLQGSGEPAPATAPVPQAQPPPVVEPKRPEPPVPRVKKPKPGPPRVYDANGPHTAPLPEGQPAVPSAGAGEPGTVTGGTSGHGGAGGLGSDSGGVRAIYAPVPNIPDELRENVFETVAVAHFHVGYDGNVAVTLAQPTSNPRLNLLVLDTLKQWRFLPAIRNGIAVDSEFDVRIPIAVQ